MELERTLELRSWRAIIIVLLLIPAKFVGAPSGGRERKASSINYHQSPHVLFLSNDARYTTGHIWACPPSEGDDYIFHCHPPDQKIPKPKRLQEWYKKMLDKSVSERIVHDYKVC